MAETMPRKRTPEEIKRLKELGAFDVGVTTIRIGGLSKERKHVFWDREDPEDR